MWLFINQFIDYFFLWVLGPMVQMEFHFCPFIMLIGLSFSFKQLLTPLKKLQLHSLGSDFVGIFSLLYQMLQIFVVN